MWRVSSLWTQVSERIWKGKLVKFFFFFFFLNRLTISTEVEAALLAGQFYDVILEVVPEKQSSDESDPVTWMRLVLIIKVILEISSWGFPGDASGKEPPCKCRRLRRCKRCRFLPWVRKIPCSRKWQPAGVQPRWIQGIRSGDGVGEDQETTA